MSSLEPFDNKDAPVTTAASERARLERLALSLSGHPSADVPLASDHVDALDTIVFEPAASWTPSGGQIYHGRDAIERRLRSLTPPLHFRVLQTEIHGRAASISGEVGGSAHAKKFFCHVIKFTGADRKRIAQLVSFEHAEAAPKGGKAAS